MARALAISGLATLGLTGCAPAPEPQGFRVAEINRLDDELLGLVVETDIETQADQLRDYATCVAARYTLITGYGFTRHIRTNRSNSGGTYRADAVYSITPTLPAGSRTLDAEVIAQNCAELGIPSS